MSDCDGPVERDLGKFVVRTRLQNIRNHVSLVTPNPMLRKTQRFEGAEGTLDAADAKRRNLMDSKAGNAISAPVPRRKWRRMAVKG